MNESLKNTYNTIMEVPEEHLLFFPGIACYIQVKADENVIAKAVKRNIFV